MHVASNPKNIDVLSHRSKSTARAVSAPERRISLLEHATAAGEPREGTDHKSWEAPFEDDPGAMRAATSAIAVGRKRAESDAHTHVDLPDLAPAVSAATTSQKATREEEPVDEREEPHLDGARIHGIAAAKVQREMHPTRLPGEIQADEKSKEETRKAAVISMAQQMYAAMPSAAQMAGEETSSIASERRRRRRTTLGIPEPSAAAQQQANLHAIAQKRVSKQLSDLDDELESTPRAIRTFRGTSAPPHRPTSYGRRWSSSEVDSAEMVQARATRKPFRPRTVEEEPSGRMDEELIAVAKRNAKMAIGDIDRQLYYTSGRPTPAMMQEWERIAHERSKARGESGQTTTFVAGREEKLEGQRDVEDLARRRVRPTLKEMDDRVNEQQGRELMDRLDMEHEMWYRQLERERELEAAEAHHRVQSMEPRVS
jgi:hypothetical protein